MDMNLAQAAQTASTTELDVAFCRGHFPALDGDRVFLENAGSTLVPDQVIARFTQFTTENQVQPGEGYPASDQDARYKFDDIVEGIIAPAREEFLAKFGTRPPAARHRIGLNEAAFNKLLGEVK